MPCSQLRDRARSLQLVPCTAGAKLDLAIHTTSLGEGSWRWRHLPFPPTRSARWRHSCARCCGRWRSAPQTASCIATSRCAKGGRSRLAGTRQLVRSPGTGKSRSSVVHAGNTTPGVAEPVITRAHGSQQSGVLASWHGALFAPPALHAGVPPKPQPQPGNFMLLTEADDSPLKAIGESDGRQSGGHQLFTKPVIRRGI
jgi:hypothetical protein